MTWRASLLGGAVLLWAGTALAHGGPATVEVLVSHPSQPARLAVGTSYGLASSLDGGTTWSLTCEGAIGETGNSHPRLAITSDGGLIAALFSGPVRSDVSGCDYAAVGDLGGVITIDMQNVPGAAQSLIALTRNGVDYGVWRSDDDGANWSQLSASVDDKFIAYSIAASNDPDRFYIGGLTVSRGVAAQLATDDGGQSFTVTPLTNPPDDPLYIEAVHPTDPDTLVAAIYEPPSKVLRSEDAGATWTEMFLGSTVLTGLAVSPSFDTIVTGSTTLGLWRATVGSAAEKISDVGVRCLTWTDDALYLCADAAVTGWAIGRSTDAGDSFSPLLELRCLTKPICDASTQVDQACLAEWPQLVESVGIETCGEGGSGGAPLPPTDDDDGGVGGNDGDGGTKRILLVGGGCAHRDGGPSWWWAAMLLVFVRRRRA